MVLDVSSRLDDPREEAETLQGNHRDIVRFTSDLDPNYIAVVGELHPLYYDLCAKSKRKHISLQVDGDKSSAPIDLPSSRGYRVCRNCRMRKSKCSGKLPNCARCQSMGIECIYDPSRGNPTTPTEYIGGMSIDEGDMSQVEKGMVLLSILRILSLFLSLLSYADIIHSLAFDQMKHREDSIDIPQWGTCVWLRNNLQFQSWLTSNQFNDLPGLLWIKGKPGSGKSTLMKATMQDPCLGDCIITSFFFNARSASDLEHSEIGMYRSLIYQLVVQDHSLCRHFVCTYCPDLRHTSHRGYSQPKKWEMHVLTKGLRSVLGKIKDLQKEVVLFIDALDECGDHVQSRRIASHLHHLAERRLLKVCISKRSSYLSTPYSCLVITIDDHNRGDISEYVGKVLSGSEISTDTRSASVVDAITSKSRGVFLWAVLVTNIILNDYEQGENWNSITTRLSEVPPALGDLYEKLLSDVPATEESVVTYRFFLWIILSTQRLRLREWHHVFPFIQDTCPTSLSSVAQSASFIESDDQLERKIRKVSRGLVEVKRAAELVSSDENEGSNDMDSAKGGAGSLEMENGETRSVEIIHDTVAQFFMEGDGFSVLLSKVQDYRIARGSMDPPYFDRSFGGSLSQILSEGHFDIMVICLVYLNITELDELVKARRQVVIGLHTNKWPTNESRDLTGANVLITESVSAPQRRGIKRVGSVASFGSAGSDAGERYSPPLEVPKMKETRGDHGYSSSARVTNNFQLEPPRERRSHLYKITKDALAEMGDVSAEETIRRFLEETDSDSNPSYSPSEPDLIEPSSLGQAKILTAFPALMHYTTTQMFVHAMEAQRLGKKPDRILHSMEKTWERYWLLREEGDVPVLVDFCRGVGLQHWVEALEDDFRQMKKSFGRVEM